MTDYTLLSNEELIERLSQQTAFYVRLLARSGGLEELTEVRKGIENIQAEIYSRKVALNSALQNKPTKEKKAE